MDEATTIALEGTFERRSADPYVLVEGTPYYFARLGLRPKERRWRARAAWERWAPSARWGVRVEGGFERVDAFAFAEDASRNNLLARTVITARLP
jgi:hypothetical protein